MIEGVDDFPAPTMPSPFPTLHLSDDEKQAILHKVNELLSESLAEYEHFLLQDRATVSGLQWKPVMKRYGLSAYRKRRDTHRDSSSMKVHTVLVVGEMEGTIEDIILGGVHVSSDLTAVFERYLYGSSSIGGATLCSIIEPTSEYPGRMVRIAWDSVGSLSSTLDAMVKPRDFVMAVASGTTTNSTGERIGYVFSHSVDVASAPPVPQAIRATRHFTYLYRQLSPDRMHVYVMGRLDPKGRMPTVVAMRISTDAALEIATRINHFGVMKKRTFLISQQQQFPRDSVGGVFPFGVPANFAAVDNNGDCSVCGKRSSNFLGLGKACVACRRPACSACIKSKRVIVSGDLSKEKETLASIKKYPFCLTCEQRAMRLSGWDLSVIESTTARAKHDGKRKSAVFS